MREEEDETFSLSSFSWMDCMARVLSAASMQSRMYLEVPEMMEKQ